MSKLLEPRLVVTLLIIVSAVVLAALGVIAGDAVLGILTGLLLRLGVTAAPPVERGQEPAAARNPRTGSTGAGLTVLALCVALGASGCGLDWGKVLSESTFILQTGSQAGKVAGGLVGVSCEAVCRYGSAGDCETCRKVESGVINAATSAGTAAAAAAGVSLIGGLLVRNSTMVEVPDVGPVRVMAVTPMAEAAQACALGELPAGAPAKRHIGFQPRDGQ